MKKNVFNTLFIFLLLFIYYGKDYFYNFLSTKINYEILNEYVISNTCDFEYESDIFDYEVTKILYRDIYDFSDEITILKGEDYLFLENYPVVDEFGLVGFISSTDSSSSKVTLLTNKDINISVKVGESFGILKYINNDLVITNLTSEDFALGDYIYTSGYSKLYEGILIGEVVKKDETSLENIYYVNTFANFNDIDYLVVIRSLK